MTTNTFPNVTTINPRTNGTARIAVAAAVLLFACAAATPAHAQVERVHIDCVVDVPAGGYGGNCLLGTVPAGKRLVIESVTARGSIPSAQTVSARLSTRVGATYALHYLQAAFLNLNNTWTEWTGSVPGVIYSDPGQVKLFIIRSSTTAAVSFWVGVTGYYE
jgi:hypothetical protein